VAGPAGQPTVAYQIPKVEFELKLNLSLQTSVAQAQDGASGRSRLLWRAARPADGQLSAEATSTVRGSFVAVPVSGGRPPPRLRTAFARRDSGQVEIRIEIRDGLGDPVPGVEVQCNIERERSATLSPPRKPAYNVHALTQIQPAVLVTDDQGRAQTLLSIADAEPPGTLLAVRIDTVGVGETLLVPVVGAIL